MTASQQRHAGRNAAIGKGEEGRQGSAGYGNAVACVRRLRRETAARNEFALLIRFRPASPAERPGSFPVNGAAASAGRGYRTIFR